MDERQRSGLSEIIPGGTAFDSPMDRVTAYRVGGKAEALCCPGELPVLKRLLHYLYTERIPWVVVGKCSNLLVGDKGIKGAVIILRDRLASVEQEGTEARELIVGGGLSVADLLSYCRINGLSGIEFMAGIPGTLGGAVFMNAGAWGLDMGSVVMGVMTVNKNGEQIIFKEGDLKFSYRASSIPEETVIYGAGIRLQRGDSDRIAEMIAVNLKRKKEKQPLDYPSAGSVFKNPPGDYAGRLIEKAGLKGARIGGAMISQKHGNFIVNTGGARASDILALMELAGARVKEETGITLETEIKILGEF
ncbi:MAG: UDP-N-acetylmuramate dehydrogenase [Deltaproteobacteria bacterium]|nr:UDP-N-acetylmuramate dehydrogenase [Deltaproteobacteria bacterium]